MGPRVKPVTDFPGIRERLRAANLELLRLREQAADLELRISATRNQIIEHGKELQALEANKARDHQLDSLLHRELREEVIEVE